MSMARRTEISSNKPKKHMPIYIPESTWLVSGLTTTAGCAPSPGDPIRAKFSVRPRGKVTGDVSFRIKQVLQEIKNDRQLQ